MCIHIYIYIYTYTHTYIHTYIVRGQGLAESRSLTLVHGQTNVYMYVYICI